MIPEPELAQMLAEIGRQIPVPDDGAVRVVDVIDADVRPSRRPSPRATRLLMVAAVLVVIGGLALLMHGNGGSSSQRTVAVAGSSSAERKAKPTTDGLVPATTAVGQHGAKGPQGAIGAQGASPTGAAGGIGGAGPQGLQGDAGIQGGVGPQGATGPAGPAGLPGSAEGLVGGDGSQTATKSRTSQSSLAAQENAPNQSPTAPIDGALVVKTGSLDLQVPTKELRPTFNRVTTTVVGLGGYVVNQNASYSAADPTGVITVRVPVNRFETAVSDINGLPGVEVLGDKETGRDVTAQYVNVQAQITALTTEEQSLLKLLSQASNLDDILNLRNQVTGVQSQIDQLQGQNNLLRNEASFSDLAITATEALPHGQKPVSATAHHSATGLSKSWNDASSGFARSVEWFIARSGAALILFLAALLFVFGLRYLYPVLRRALL